MVKYIYCVYIWSCCTIFNCLCSVGLLWLPDSGHHKQTPDSWTRIDSVYDYVTLIGGAHCRLMWHTCSKCHSEDSRERMDTVMKTGISLHFRNKQQGTSEGSQHPCVIKYISYRLFVSSEWRWLLLGIYHIYICFRGFFWTESQIQKQLECYDDKGDVKLYSFVVNVAVCCVAADCKRVLHRSL